MSADEVLDVDMMRACCERFMRLGCATRREAAHALHFMTRDQLANTPSPRFPAALRIGMAASDDEVRQAVAGAAAYACSPEWLVGRANVLAQEAVLALARLGRQIRELEGATT